MTDTETICTFTLDGLFLGLNVGDVHEVLLAQSLTAVPLAHPVVAGLINIRGQIVSAVDLRRVLHLPPRSSESDPPVNVVVRNGNELVSFQVDLVGDVLELDSKGLTPPPETTSAETKHLFRGAYQRPEQLLLVIDTSRAMEAIVAQARSKLARHLN